MLKAALAHPSVYLMLQRALRADRARYECLRELDVRPGHKVLDVGCGPAYYVGSLPPDVEYHGFDTDARYIAWAKQKFGDRADFHLDTYTEAHREKLPRFDRVLLMGLLHHLGDDDARGLLSLIGRSLAPGGVVVALDTCTDPQLSSFQNWLAKKDRGQFVRETSAFRELGESAFTRVEGRLGEDRFVPVRLWIMRLEGPRDAA